MSENGGEGRLPWHRNPWVWGVLAGLILVPAVRPLTRKVPDAPPILSQLPDFRLETAGGTALGSRELRGHVYVLAVGTTDCSSTCSEVFARAERLADRFQTYDRGVRVVALDYGRGGRPMPSSSAGRGRLAMGGSAEAPAGSLSASSNVTGSSELPSWLVLHGSEAVITGLVDSGLRPLFERAVAPDIESFSHEARMFLIDPDGKIRGHYGSDEVGLDEVYHRAQHVLRDYRSEHRWDH